MVIRSAGRHRARRRGEQEPRAEGPSAHDGSKAAAKPHRIPTHSISTHPNPSHGTHDGENSAVWLQPQEGTARHGTAMHGTARQCKARHSDARQCTARPLRLSAARHRWPHGEDRAKRAKARSWRAAAAPPLPPLPAQLMGWSCARSRGLLLKQPYKAPGSGTMGSFAGCRAMAEPAAQRSPAGRGSLGRAAAAALGSRSQRCSSGRGSALRRSVPRGRTPPPHPQPPAAAGRRHRGLKGAGRARRFPPSRRSSLPALGLRAPSRPGAAPAPARRPRPRAALSFPPSTGDLLPPRPPSPHVSPLFPRSGSLRPALPCLPLSFPSSPASGPGWDLRARRGGGEEREHRTAPPRTPPRTPGPAPRCPRCGSCRGGRRGGVGGEPGGAQLRSALGISCAAPQPCPPAPRGGALGDAAGSGLPARPRRPAHRQRCRIECVLKPRRAAFRRAGDGEVRGSARISGRGTGNRKAGRREMLAIIIRPNPSSILQP